MPSVLYIDGMFERQRMIGWALKAVRTVGNEACHPT